jgi:hypothetical protein
MTAIPIQFGEDINKALERYGIANDLNIANIIDPCEETQKIPEKIRRLRVVNDVEGSDRLETERQQLIDKRDELLGSIFYWVAPRIRIELSKIDRRLDEIEFAIRDINGGRQREEQLRKLLDDTRVLLAEGKEILSKRNGSSNP